MWNLGLWEIINISADTYQTFFICYKLQTWDNPMVNHCVSLPTPYSHSENHTLSHGPFPLDGIMLHMPHPTFTVIPIHWDPSSFRLIHSGTVRYTKILEKLQHMTWLNCESRNTITGHRNVRMKIPYQSFLITLIPAILYQWSPNSRQQQEPLLTSETLYWHTVL
jgi:hypothetical protein